MKELEFQDVSYFSVNEKSGNSEELKYVLESLRLTRTEPTLRPLGFYTLGDLKDIMSFQIFKGVNEKSRTSLEFTRLSSRAR